jgi:hypothetical protein
LHVCSPTGWSPMPRTHRRYRALPRAEGRETGCAA